MAVRFRGVPMKRVLLAIRNQFTFTTDTFEEHLSLRRPIYKSANFRNNTIVLAGSLLMGLFVLIRFWRALPPDSRWLVLVAIGSILGVWFRTVHSYSKLRRIAGQRRYDYLQNESVVHLLRCLTGTVNFSQYVLYVVTLLLLVALGLAVK